MPPRRLKVIERPKADDFREAAAFAALRESVELVGGVTEPVRTGLGGVASRCKRA
jgi:hypothetical protein